MLVHLVRWLVLVLVSALVSALGACSDGGSPGAGPGGSCAAPPPPLSGEGTYYDADGTGNCGFDPDPGRMVAAMNAVDYDTAAWCGACLRVSGPDGEVTVRVVDQCPECAHGDLDLSREAFAKIAPLSAGRVPITWHEVACEVDGPLRYHFKDGSNPWWTAIQIREHRYPIAKVEARRASGAFEPIPRVSYNYFVESDGLGDGPYTFRVTDTRGHVLEDTGIEAGDDVTRSGAAQFPVCDADADAAS